MGFAAKPVECFMGSSTFFRACSRVRDNECLRGKNGWCIYDFHIGDRLLHRHRPTALSVRVSVNSVLKFCSILILSVLQVLGHVGVEFVLD
jgi:hypothetical protein